MEFEQTSLMPQVNAIINAGNVPVHFQYSAIIHVTQTGVDVNALKYVQGDILADFENNYTDDLRVFLAVPTGTFANQIYPFQDSLEVTIQKTPIMGVGTAADASGQVSVVRYQAVLRDEGNPITEGNGYSMPTQQQLDMMNFSVLEFQLFDPATAQLRMASVGGIHQLCTVEDALKVELTNASAAMQVDDSLKIQGVEMVPASNQNVQDTFIIPHGLPIVTLPDYIQETQGGIYSAGIGAYLRNRCWFIYPCYDPSRLNNTDRFITVIIVPENRFPFVETTYKQDGNHLMILATGQVKFRGDSTPQQLNYGNGVRFADADKMMQGFTQGGDNKALAARGNLNNEYTNVTRPNGDQNIQLNSRAITANAFVPASELARRNGSVIALNWQNSNSDLVKPATMGQIFYLDGDSVSQVSGVLLKGHTSIQMQGKGITDGRHIQSTMLSFFVSNPSS